MLVRFKKPHLSRYLRILTILLCIGGILGHQATAFGIDPTLEKYYRQQIKYYEEDLGCGPSGSSTDPDTSNPTPSSESVYILGDSITVGAKSLLEAGFNDVTVNGSVGRSILRKGTSAGNKTSGIEAIKQPADQTAIKNAGAIVVALGTNGEGSADSFKSHLKQLLTDIRSINDSANLYVVTIFSPAVSQKDQYNQMIAGFSVSAENPELNYKVIDAADKNIEVGGDNIHPTPNGQKTFAETIISGVNGGQNDPLNAGRIEVSGNCVCSNGDNTITQLPGSDNEEKVWNYFTINKKLTPIQTAGIMGNMARESGFNPENIQNPAGDTKDPSGLSAGWGLIQWTPGSKVIGIAQKANITGPIYELETQLDIVWWHMTNTSPTGVKNMLAQYKPTDEKDAARIFEHLMEGAGVPALADREAAASAALTKYGGGSPGGGATFSVNENSDVSCATADAGSGSQSVNADGYALPVEKEGMNLPCGKPTCHHDGTPAADLGIAPKWEGTAVYAITSGKITNVHYRRGLVGPAAPQECKSFQLIGDDGWAYWYGHIRNVVVKDGQEKTVKAGDKIAEIGQSACADTTPPHLHIDRGSPKGHLGGSQCCRDPGFVPLLDKIYEETK